MATKLNYLGALERIESIAGAHPQVNSVDDGRELEFDTKKTDLWPRVFIRTESGSVLGGLGSATATAGFSLLVMDRLDTKRNNVRDVLNSTHSIMIDILATLHKNQVIRLEDNQTYSPLIDYQDTQAAGWTVDIFTYLDMPFMCYDQALDLSPEYQAVYDYWTNKPSDAVALFQDAFVRKLVSDGVWALEDLLYVWAIHTNDDGEARVNWKDPGTFTLSEFGSPVFTPYYGFTGSDATNAYLQSFFRPSLHNINASQNSMHVGNYSFTPTALAGDCDVGGIDGTDIFLFNQNSLGEVGISLNRNSSDGEPLTNGAGLIIANRPDSATEQVYREGTKEVEISRSSNGVCPTALTWLARNTPSDNPAVFSRRQLGLGTYGASLDAGKQSSFSNAFNTYLSAVGSI